MKWSALVLVVYLGLPFCSSLVKRIRPQEYLAIQSSCEKWFVIFINSWCWNTLLVDDFVFRLRSLLYNLEGVANIGVIDGVADAGFYNLFGYGGMQFVQLIDPPCSNVALLRNPNVRNLLPYFDPQKITRELISLVGVYEQDGCKLQKFAVQEKIDTSAILDSCHFWVVFETSKIDQSSYDRCHNDYMQLARHFEGDFKFAFVPTNQQSPRCTVSVYGLNKEQPARFNLVSNEMATLYGVPSFLDEYRSRYRPCSTFPWQPVDLFDVMTSCKSWIVASVAQDSDWPCVREIEKFAVYSKDKFEFGTVKGSTFGVWLFLENKLMPVLAMSDPTTCKVPAVFAILKGELNKASLPPNQVCDSYASSPYDVEAITILNQKKLMDIWENTIVLQSSPFDPNYHTVYNEFKTLFNQLKGSFRFGFMLNSQFGLWLYGTNKNSPYLITSDLNDFQSRRYLSMLVDTVKGRGSNTDFSSLLSPYLANLRISNQNFGNLVLPQMPQQIPQQLPQQVPYYPIAGGWNIDVNPSGMRDLEINHNDNSNVVPNKKSSAEKVVNVSLESKDCKKDCIDCDCKSPNHGKGENIIYYGSRGLDLEETPSTEDEASEEFILEPVLNLTTFPDKWKAGLNELFANSKDLVVKVSFPYPMGWKKTESKNEVKTSLDTERVVTTLIAPPTTDATPKDTSNYDLSGARTLTIGQTSRITTTTANYGTENVIKQITEAITVLPSSTESQDLATTSSGAREIGHGRIVTVTTSGRGETEIVTTDVKNITATSVRGESEHVTTTFGGELEKSYATGEISTEADITLLMETSSQYPPPESSIPTAESSTDAEIVSESTTIADVKTVTISTDVGVSEMPKLLTSTEGGSEASSTTEAVVTEMFREPSNATVGVTENTTESGARVTDNEISPILTVETTKETNITQKESTIASTSEPTLLSTSKQRIIETTDVETVRKDCKFWVLISSSEDTEADEKYEQCYEKLTTIMSNYKSVYKFGAVHTGEFFINLYLKNKSNPITILSDYSCDEEKLRSTLDAYKTETPGEFCQDPEDVSDYE